MPIRQAVWRQILPAVASQMIALIYNLADTYFVGMMGDPGQTAAVTVVSSSFLMLTAISNLFGIGGASLIARALGARDRDKARQVSALALWGGLAGACLFSLLFLLLSDPILRLCGATEGTVRIAGSYAMWAVVIGGPAAIVNTLLANLVRAEGSAARAAAGVSLGGVVNILLDPFFVLPQFLGLGAVGAGMATALSNALAALYFLLLCAKRGTSVLTLRPSALRGAGKYLRELLAVGFPASVQYALTVVAVAAQSRFVSHYATEAVAGLGIVKKLDQLPLYFSIGVSNGLLPLLAYNYASGNQARRRATFRFGVGISLGFSLLCLVCYEAFAPFLTGLFIDNALTTQYSAAFLRIMVTAMPMMAVCYPMIVQFQAMGRVRESLICSVLRKGVLDIPLLFILDALLPLYGCMMVQPIVDAVSLAVAAAFYRKVNR